jgi:hypothetical protein
VPVDWTASAPGAVGSTTYGNEGAYGPSTTTGNAGGGTAEGTTQGALGGPGGAAQPGAHGGHGGTASSPGAEDPAQASAARAPAAQPGAAQERPPAAPSPPASLASPAGAQPPAAQPATAEQPAPRRTPGVDYGAALLALVALLAAVLAFIAARLALRPVRRHLIVRHLRRPLYAETIDQRVSNLWQLALIGLRDAGWETPFDEQPGALARRVGDPALAACAAVLERARHGVRVDGADLAAMADAAAAVYTNARRRAGALARAVGWLRSPLV